MCNLPITNFIRNNHIVFELPCICRRVQLAYQIEIVGQIFEDGFEKVGLVAVEEELLFETDTLIANHFTCSLRSIFEAVWFLLFLLFWRERRTKMTSLLFFFLLFFPLLLTCLFLFIAFRKKIHFWFLLTRTVEILRKHFTTPRNIARFTDSLVVISQNFQEISFYFAISLHPLKSAVLCALFCSLLLQRNWSKFHFNQILRTFKWHKNVIEGF